MSAEYDHVEGFPPTARGESTHTLILGSAPSVASLKQQQYYGHKQNHFWRIMGELFDAGHDIDYPERTKRLAQHGIAVWDVLQSCKRPGSLDSAISSNSIKVNNFNDYFGECPNLRQILLNGRFAEKTFHKHVAPPAHIHTHYLPSTSPANAGMRYTDKRAAWEAALYDHAFSTNEPATDK